MAPRLLGWAHAPPHLRFNPFVRGGYRPLCSGGGCLRSLFYLHNELGNIYSHGVPLVAFVLLVPGALPGAPGAVWWLGAGHCVALVAPPLGSVLYHLFMSHRQGPRLYRRLLAIDVAGVAVVNGLGAVPIIYSWLPCQPWPRGAALGLYGGLSLLALRSAVSAASSARRLAAFAGPALFRLLVLGFRAAGLGGGAPGALSCYGRMDALALLGGAVNAARVPERWSPGRFDYWGNSHQLMHLLVVLGLLNLHWGVAQDLQWVVQNPCPSQ